MKLKFKKIYFLVIILFAFTLKEGQCTILIPSMIMAMSGGLLMGKMTMGGLLMMLMAANQQQNGQSFLRNLGVIPQQTPSSGISIPTVGAEGEGSQGISEPFQELIVRRRRHFRQKRETNATDTGNSTSSEQTSQKPKDHKSKPFVIDEVTQYRIMRQVASSDPLSCLPQALCGIQASPPSSQSGFLNDYTYLLKTVFTRDEDIDDLDKEEYAEGLTEFDKLKYDEDGKPKSSTTTKSKLVPRTEVKSGTSTSSKKSSQSPKRKKKPILDDDSSEEEQDDEPASEQEMNKQMMREQYEVEEMANAELLDDDPDFFPYAMRESAGHFKGPHGGPPQRPSDIPPPREEDEFVGMAPSDLHNMSEDQLNAMLAKLGPGGPSRGPPPGYSNSNQGESFLSKIMPKVSMGLTPGKGNNFENDPFFSGFKRSLDKLRDGGVDVKVDVRPVTVEEEKLFKEMVKRRRSRVEYIAEKKKELANVQDPVEKFRIAAEFGQRLKSPRQCRVLFNNCPFNYTQVLEMIAGLRKVILGQPLTEPQKEVDTVVTLKPIVITAPPPPPEGAKNIINLNTGSGGAGGVTSISHQLPSGEKVEINLKMTKTGLTQTKRKSKPKGTAPNSKPTANASMPPHLSILSKKKPKPGQSEDPFADDGDKKTSSGSKVQALHSLESLKATMLAIQKINNVTVQRKKEGKPVSYTHVLAELDQLESKTKEANKESAKPSTTTTEEPTLPEPDPLVLTKLQQQNSRPKPKKTNSAKKTASLLATSLTKVEDDEFEEELPSVKIVKGTSIRVKTPPFPPRNKNASSETKSNEELAEILAKLKRRHAAKVRKENAKKTNSKVIVDEEQADINGTEEDEYDDDGDDEEEDEIDNLNSSFTKFKSDLSDVPKDTDPEERVLITVPLIQKRTTTGSIIPTQIFNRRILTSQSNTNLERPERIKKPRKLFLGHDVGAPRYIPL